MNVEIVTSICTRCKRREAIFYRQYSGERLCEECFTMSIEEKVRATIAKYEMFKFDDRIAVAVSGGKDSINLLHILAKMKRRHPKASLVGVTVDEGIKGYRDEALDFAARSCKKLEIDHHVVSFQQLYGLTLDEIIERASTRGKKKLTPCAYCGVLRRQALNVTARKLCASKIATGHTLDDEVQTILLNIFRGDISRLPKEKPVTEMIHPDFVQKVKPFWEILEKESALYAYLKKTPFQDIPCPYASEALRNEIRAMLNRMETNHPGTKFTVAKSLERIWPALEQVAKKDGFKRCNKCGEPSSGDLCRACDLLKQIY